MHALNFISDNLTFEMARERFISWVCPFQALGDKRVTIVFDDNVHMQGPHEIHSRIHVIYSPKGFNADGTILSIVRNTEASLRQHLIAVTRDTMLRDAILSYGCTVISPKSFASEFKAYQTHSQRKDSIKNFNASDKRFLYQPFRAFFK